MATLCISEGGADAVLSDGDGLSTYNTTQQQYSLAASAVVTRCYQPSYVITPLSDSNAVVALIFSQKSSLEWAQLKSSIAYHLNALEDDIDELKVTLGGDKGAVSAAHFAKVLKWFSPLVPEAELRSSGGFSSAFVWRISSIADLLRQQWFHGFAPDVNNRLRNSPTGTFLLRFGCQAPHFILSLKDQANDSVVEWRVLSMSGSVRLVDSERFMNLHQLVENYSHTVPAGASCVLDFPCNRANTVLR